VAEVGGQEIEVGGQEIEVGGQEIAAAYFDIDGQQTIVGD
jgi:hypothetical protein